MTVSTESSQELKDRAMTRHQDMLDYGVRAFAWMIGRADVLKDEVEAMGSEHFEAPDWKERLAQDLIVRFEQESLARAMKEGPDDSA